MKTKILFDDIKFLLNKRLLQICVGEYCVIYKFEEDVAITIEGKYILDINDSHYECFGDIPSSIEKAFFLLGESIVSIKILSDNTIILSFSNNAQIRLVLNDSLYESYTITYKNNQIVI